MRVFLDDRRPAPEGWTLVRWPEDAIALLETGAVEELSLDHDLGDDRRGTGYDVLTWIEEAVATRGFRAPPIITVHSANAAGRLRMAAAIAAIRRFEAGPQASMDVFAWKRAAYYLVVDLEATTSDGGRAFPPQEMETIEIGAVLVQASTLAIAGEFRTVVRPIRHPVLLPFCTALTGIPQDGVDVAPLFPHAFAELRGHMLAGRDGVVWGSWGRYDDEQLRQDCALHRVPYDMPAHLDLKDALSTAQGWRRRYGLSKALTRCGLTQEGAHHRALDDARNTARMLPWIVGGRRTSR